MDMVISILMSCAFSAPSFPAALATGQLVTASCSGSYTDRQDGQRLGTWRMSLDLQREAAAPAGLLATRRSYAVDVDPKKPVNLQTLPDDTQAFVVREIRAAVERHASVQPGETFRIPMGI